MIGVIPVLRAVARILAFTRITVYPAHYTVSRVMIIVTAIRERVAMLIHSPHDLAQYYRDQRKQRGVSQTAIAEDVAVRQDTVSKFENKPDNVRLETLFRLLSALDLELHLVPKEESLSNALNKKEWTEAW